MWATRILRREGLGKQWRERSIVYPTEIKMDKMDNIDQNDLDYLCYHKPPIGYITNNDKDKFKITSDETEDEKTIIRSLQYWYDTYSTRKYWDAFDHRNGNIIFSNVKWDEYNFKKDAEINAIRDENTNLLKPKDSTKKINPYSIIPEENPRSEYIQYGSRYLSDYVDFKPPKTDRLLTYNDDTKLLGTISYDDDTKDNKDEKDSTFDYKKTEGYKFNRSFKWMRGFQSGQSLKDNISDIENIEFPKNNDAEEIERVLAERKSIDQRTDLEKNRRFSGLVQLKSLLPSKEEISIIMKFKWLSLKKAFNMVLDDYKFVFGKNNGGGQVLRYGYPPQISLQEFTSHDQFECALGSFGAMHSLFSDWFIAIDNKREDCDKSYGKAQIINDRLIFDGFLIHSCVEMGHRTRNGLKDFIGFVNLVSHEFEPEIDLLNYYSIGIKLRSDGRPYLLGLECLNRNKFVVFNGIISIAPTPEDEWDYYEIPLHHFRPYDNGEFIQGEQWMKVRYLRSLAIQAIGSTGSFKLEIAWIRAMSFNARFDINDEDISFIQDIDALGLYKEDLLKFHIIQHQYFIDAFPDPFRYEDNGVFDDNVYLGPPRSQRQHFGEYIPPDLLKYIDVIDDIPLSLTTQKYLNYYLDSDDMYMFENYLSDKLIGTTKAIQHLYKYDSLSISDATNNLLYNQLKNQSRHNQYLSSGVYHTENIHRTLRTEETTVSKMPFVFKDIRQTSNSPITILTQRRRELLRFSVPEHLRERVVGKWPQLV